MSTKTKLFLFLLISFCLVNCTEHKNESPIAKKIEIEAPFEIELTDLIFPDDTLLITDFGAQQSLTFDNGPAINEAILTAHENGGGTVFIPEGSWYSTRIVLKSNVNLHLEKGAVISFSNNKADYLPPVTTRWEGIECKNYSSLIYAIDCENIAITGKGKLQGNGEPWWPDGKKKKISLSLLYDMVMDGVPASERIMTTSDSLSYLRPSFVQFINCTKVLLSDYTISNGPMWTNHLIYCQNVIARNLQVITSGLNNDGLVIDSSQDVLVENCFFSTGDDCVVIKSGLNEDGWRVAKPSKNIVVRKCVTEKGHGGVVIGSEMSGGVENVLAYDCQFSGTGRGLRIKSMRGRGAYVKNIYFKGIKMDSIKNEAIMINMRYPSSSIAPRGDKVPEFDNINIEDITTKYARHALRMQGLSNRPISGINIRNFSCESSKFGLRIDSCQDIALENIQINSWEKTIRRFAGNSDLKIENLILNGQKIESLQEVSQKLFGFGF